MNPRAGRQIVGFIITAVIAGPVSHLVIILAGVAIRKLAINRSDKPDSAKVALIGGEEFAVALDGLDGLKAPASPSRSDKPSALVQ